MRQRLPLELIGYIRDYLFFFLSLSVVARGIFDHVSSRHHHDHQLASIVSEDDLALAQLVLLGRGRGEGRGGETSADEQADLETACRSQIWQSCFRAASPRTLDDGCWGQETSASATPLCQIICCPLSCAEKKAQLPPHKKLHEAFDCSARMTLETHLRWCNGRPFFCQSSCGRTRGYLRTESQLARVLTSPADTIDGTNLASLADP